MLGRFVLVEGVDKIFCDITSLFVFCTEQDITEGTSLPSLVFVTQAIKEVSQDRTASMSSAIYVSPKQESIFG